VLLSASSSESWSELLVASSIMMGSSSVSPCASISIVAVTVVADELAVVSDWLVSVPPAVGVLLVGVVSVSPAWCSCVLAAGSLRLAGSCCWICFTLREAAFRLAIRARLWSSRSCTYGGIV